MGSTLMSFQPNSYTIFFFRCFFLIQSKPHFKLPKYACGTQEFYYNFTTITPSVYIHIFSFTLLFHNSTIIHSISIQVHISLTWPPHIFVFLLWLFSILWFLTQFPWTWPQLDLMLMSIIIFTFFPLNTYINSCVTHMLWI